MNETTNIEAKTMTHKDDWKPAFKPTRPVFEQAIEAGRLTRNPEDPNYAGKYMYMHTDPDGTDRFKNVETRRYDV